MPISLLCNNIDKYSIIGSLLSNVNILVKYSCIDYYNQKQY